MTSKLNNGRTGTAAVWAQGKDYHVFGTPVTTCTVTVTAEPAGGGTFTGNGDYVAGETVSLTAMPATGYTFVNWTENGTEVSKDASYTFPVNGDRTLVANFEQIPVTYTVTFVAWNGAVLKMETVEAGKVPRPPPTRPARATHSRAGTRRLIT